jgi:hypothetical protein
MGVTHRDEGDLIWNSRTQEKDREEVGINSLPTLFTVIGIVEKLMMIPDSMPRAFM